MTRELLQSVVLYFASAAAQVWGTLMVFHVLLMRDLCLFSDQALDQEDRNARPWLDRLLAKLRNTAPDQDRRLGALGLDSHMVAVAETDREVRLQIIRSARTHQTIEKEAVTYQQGNQNFDPGTLQKLFDRSAEKIEKIEATEEEPNRAFYVGLTGVAVNLSLLLTYALVGDEVSYLRALLAALLAVDAILAVVFARQIRRALTCYY